MTSTYNPEKYDKAKAKLYYQANKAKIAEQRKLYYSENKQRINQYHKQYMLLRKYKQTPVIDQSTRIKIRYGPFIIRFD